MVVRGEKAAKMHMKARPLSLRHTVQLEIVRIIGSWEMVNPARFAELSRPKSDEARRREVLKGLEYRKIVQGVAQSAYV